MEEEADKIIIKPCRICGSKDISKNRIAWNNWICKACERDYFKKYREKNKKRLADQRIARRNKVEDLDRSYDVK